VYKHTANMMGTQSFLFHK